MNLLENFKMAIDSIKSNKMRSFLTMLGIIIGISSVIAIVALGQGGQNAITGEFEKIGAATVNIKVDTAKAQPTDYINYEDIKQIKEKVEMVKYVSPSISKQGNVASESKSARAFISAGNADLTYISNVEILYGRFYNEREFIEGKPVVVIDENAAKALFGYEDAVGKSLKIGPKSTMQKATIVGISKGFMNPFRGTQGDNIMAFVYCPITLVERLYPSEFSIDTVSLVATTQEAGEDAGNGARNILESRHNNRGKDVYLPENSLKQLEQVNQVLGILTAFIGAVAAISLLVGGIGVMNIMLVSVTERTREIGIRKAIGADTNTILLQFLTESVILTVIGGIIGMILGILGAELIGSFANITPSVSVSSIIVAIIFSSAIGIFFGIYPAKKAANLNPIDALRYE